VIAFIFLHKCYRLPLYAGYQISTIKDDLLCCFVPLWEACLTGNLSAISLTPAVSLSKKLYPHCLVLVGSRRHCFECDFKNKI